ncbi:hypothetical protein ACEPAG_2129 [Sanghuangporus baumii]
MKPLFDFSEEQAGCGGFGSVEATVGCLRAASIDALARAQDVSASFNRSPYKVWRPVMYGTLISDYPMRVLAEGICSCTYYSRISREYGQGERFAHIMSVQRAMKR